MRRVMTMIAVCIVRADIGLMSRIGIGTNVRALLRRVMARGVEALLSMERHEHETEAVERGDEYTEHDAPIGIRCAGNMRRTDGSDDCVFGEEAGGTRDCNQSK